MTVKKKQNFAGPLTHPLTKDSSISTRKIYTGSSKQKKKKEEQ